MHDKEYDVVIVGAGPAGSYAAYCCAKFGLKTLLLDREHFPRDKPCGGILEAKYFVRYAPFLVGHEVNITYYTGLYYDYRKLLVRPLKSYIFHRSTFDSALVKRAMDIGVKFHDCAKVIKLEQNQNHAIVTWKKNDNKNDDDSEQIKVRAKLCIGADGINSIVRKSIELDRSRIIKDRLIAIMIKDAEPKNDLIWEMTTEYGKPSIASFFFSSFPGFCWAAPAKETLNVGIGVHVKNSQGLKSRFKEFLIKVGLEHEFDKSKCSSIPAMPLQNIYSARVMLVGDAAGTVNPWTGGGINLGFHSGLMAAKTAARVLNGKQEKNNKDRNLQAYQDLMDHTLKMLRLKGNLVKFITWSIQHKLTSPEWERFILRRFFPIA